MRTRWAAIGAAVAVSLGAGAVFVASAATTEATEFRAITPCRLLDTRTSEQKGMFAGRIGPTLPLTGADAGNQLLKNDLTVIFDPDAKTLTTNVSGAVSPKPLMGDCAALVAADGEIESTIDPLAVMLNVTVLNSTAASFITVYPWQIQIGDYTADKAGRAFVSQLNPIAGHPPITNSVSVELVNTASFTPIPGASCDPNCNGYKAFRLYNDQGLTDVFVDVIGYWHQTE